MVVKSKNTRFRAYQLFTAGSSYSYFDGSRFTLIEARLTDANTESLAQEMQICGIDQFDTLHITSWDQDHCVPAQLEALVDQYKPRKIEYPGYSPHTERGMESLSIIESYKSKRTAPIKIVQISPAYIDSLKIAENYGYKNILYHPRKIDPDSSNNNSTVKQFRSGSFNVLSLGDVESEHIAAGLRRMSTVHNESDIMILAHHGANNGFTTASFLRKIRPSVAIACADFANQFEHPKPEIRDLLYKFDIRLFTTKTGDVVIYSTGSHTGSYRVVNLIAGSSEISSAYDYSARKYKYLSANMDQRRVRQFGISRGPGRKRGI